MDIYKLIKGDKYIWTIVCLLSIFSVVMVYSSSSYLAFAYKSGNSLSYLFRHLFHLFIGFLIMGLIAMVPYKYFYNISYFIFCISLIMIFFSIKTNIKIEGVNASRWIKLAGFTFQPSELAKLSLFMLLSRNLVHYKDKLHSIRFSFIPILLPILIICSLILPSDFSSAAIIFLVSLIIIFVGGLNFKSFFLLVISAIISFIIFFKISKTLSSSDSRVFTWESRISSYFSSKNKLNYQVNQAKKAIYLGGVWGNGPGKSIQKYFLPQSSSDFIFAIIIEEYGRIGALIILSLYLFFIYRVLKIGVKCEDQFALMLSIGLGLSIISQAFLNMLVAVNLIPVTGQTLPLLSAGGSSVWITCASIGIILSISKSVKKLNYE